MDVKKILRNRTIRTMLLRAFGLLSIINQVIPKRRDKILLYDSFNLELEDNTRALLLHLLRNGYQKRYRIYCAMPRNPGYSEFADQGIRTVGPVGSILHFLTAKYYFTSYGNIRIRPAHGQRVINLWHGTPLKTIGRLGGDHPDENLDFFTCSLAASAFYKPIMARAFGCSERKILICGHARTDELFLAEDEFPKLGLGEDHWRRKILWMPTFRVSSDGIYAEGRPSGEQETGLPVIRTREAYEALNIWLAERDILLMIKVHNYSAALQISDCSHIRMVSGAELRAKGIELYALIKSFDALVTDYSSVMFDYLLLDRPIGFAADDLEQYEANRGFVVEDPRKLMAGAQFSEPEGMRQFLQDVLDGTDAYKEARARVRKLTNRYTDGNNCRRVLQKAGLRQ